MEEADRILVAVSDAATWIWAIWAAVAIVVGGLLFVLDEGRFSSVEHAVRRRAKEPAKESCGGLRRAASERMRVLAFAAECWAHGFQRAQTQTATVKSSSLLRSIAGPIEEP